MKIGGLFISALGTVFLLLAAACGGGAAEPADTPSATAKPQPTATAQPTATSQPTAPTEPVGPDAALVAEGMELYMNVPANAAPQALWCFQCHMIEDLTAGLIGPEHTHLATNAATRVPGLSAEEYIRESIVEPEKRVAEGVERATPGLMTKAIIENLTEDQVDALVAFLLTLE